MLNNLPQMHLKLLQKKQFKKQQKQFFIAIMIADKIHKSQVVHDNSSEWNHVERTTPIAKLNLKLRC